jgi:hypothetical protein
MDPWRSRLAAAWLALSLSAPGCHSRHTEVVLPEPAQPSASSSVAPAPSETSSAAPSAIEERPASAAPAPAPSPRTRYVDGGPSDTSFDAEEAERADWPKGWVPSRIRETATVVVEGVKERWSLVWTSLPQPQCFGLETTCPCFELGDAEEGELELWRERPGQKTEVRVLTGFGHAEGLPPGIAVPRFPGGTPLETAALKRARTVRVLNVHDYNHDGLAAEFPLTGMYLNQCNGNDRETWLIGVTRKKPVLHGIGTVNHPDAPLTFGSRRDWEAVRAAKTGTEVKIYECWQARGGSAAYDLVFGPEGIGGSLREYECDYSTPTPRRTRLTATHEL